MEGVAIGKRFNLKRLYLVLTTKRTDVPEWVFAREGFGAKNAATKRTQELAEIKGRSIF
jgi:hypothetical protein